MGSDPVMLHWSDTIRCRNSGAMYQILAALEGLPEVALLTVPPGKSSPPDQHESNEVWIVAEGSGALVCGDKECTLAPGDAVLIPANTRHVANAGLRGVLRLVSLAWQGS